jgi:DNA ligase-1
MLETLYTRTNTGAIQQWSVEVEGNKYRTCFGQVNGKFQTTKWTVCEGTNVGRSNERNCHEQALFEAEAIWKKKKDSGYYTDIADVDNVQFVEPMLAKNYEDYKMQTFFPVYSQPKLDGIRCVVTKSGMFSRNGKRFVSCPHIQNELKEFFERNPTAILDGELYTNDLKDNFNKICSLVKKTKPTDSDLLESARTIQYWIYDTIRKESFKDRYIWIITQINESDVIKLVETSLVETYDQLNDKYEDYLVEGFEGQMIRTDSKYENKRSKFLLKRKEFKDQEYVIKDIVEGQGNKTGVAGAMWFVNPMGIEFSANIKGDREYLREIWSNKSSYVGKIATVKYFNLTPETLLPRFPYVIAIRDYE